MDGMRDTLIEINNVSKEYRLYDEADRSLKGTIVRFLRTGGLGDYKHKKVLSDFSFTLRQGDVVGVVGENGAGKSTLLKMIAGIISPTHGRVSVHGNVVALLEIGLGFNDDLTGRENAYLYGSLLGIPNKVMKEMLPEIIEFSEVPEYIDLPMRKYSSGMKMRLAFAIATAIDPEILILDEVFSVGDVFFKKKSEDRIGNIISRGRGLLLVTHDTETVLQVCNRAILLKSDASFTVGTPEEIIAEYLGRRSLGETATQ